VIAVVRPHWVPALPLQARTYREADGRSGYVSLALLGAASVAVGVLAFERWAQIKPALGGDPAFTPALEEKVVIAVMAGIVFAFAVSMADKLLRLNLLSRLARQVTFVLIPPLLLVFLVLGTIFLGVATPTEGGAMGAVGALVLALVRRRLSFALLKQALDSTARLSIFVLMILIGSTLFSLSFTAIDGNDWVKALFAAVPGGELGFLIFVVALVFFLGLFLEFFEIAFIVLPLLLPVAQALDINLVYLGVLIGVTLQTSFLTPPVGFSLFYLRSVAAKDDHNDVLTGARIPGMSTNTINLGATAFVALQCVMVAVMIWKPEIVMAGLGEQKKVDVQNVNINITAPEEDEEPPPVFGTPASAPR
jgi:TRAP-type mannitol/chloroaromatic compound transport system permease large subunit